MSHDFLASPQFQISVLLMVALAGHVLASRIGQSAVIGEILVGVAVGPSLLGLVSYTDFVRELADIGAIVLLFVIGLEFDLKDILKRKYFLIAALGVAVPWLAGYGVVAAFGYGAAEAVFAGTAMTATSIAITANVLKEMGKLETGAAKAIIGAAVIDDVLGLVALSLTVGAADSSLSVLGVAVLLAKTLAFLAAGGAIGYFGVRRLIVLIDSSRLTSRYPETPFIFAMAMAFAYAAFAELVGLSAIVGAFLAGSCMGGISLAKGRSYEEGADYLRIIFASIFFVSLGVLADLRAVSWGVVALIAVLTLVAVASKLLGCGLPALLSGSSPREALSIGFGMTPRGEVAMIVALIGLEKGIVEQDLYIAIMMMSLLTTVVTPAFLTRTLSGPSPAAGPR